MYCPDTWMSSIHHKEPAVHDAYLFRMYFHLYLSSYISDVGVTHGNDLTLRSVQVLEPLLKKKDSLDEVS